MNNCNMCSTLVLHLVIRWMIMVMMIVVVILIIIVIMMKALFKDGNHVI